MTDRSLATDDSDQTAPVVESSGSASTMARTLLAWWEINGRRDRAQKPWMFTAAGRWPTAAQDLDPYGIWIAEVMLQQTPLQGV